METNWNRESITKLLLESDKAVERALLVLYANQTAEEQASKSTRHNNGKGFGQFDARIFSSFARWIQAGKHLSPRMLALCRKLDKRGNVRIAKYHAQLIAAIAQKQGGK